MPRRVLFLALIASSATNAQAQTPDRDGYWEPVPQTRDDSERTFRNDALTVLQGSDTVEFFAPRLVEMTASAIRQIRATYPAVRGIGVMPRFSMHVTIFDSAAVAAIGRVGSPIDYYHHATDILTRAGLPEFDSLDERLGVKEVRAERLYGVATLSVRFEGPVNIPVISRRYQRLPYIKFAGLSFYGRDGDWILLIPKGPLFHFVFEAGRGDCPSGCIYRDYWYFTFDTLSKTITANGQLLSSQTRGDTIYLWDVPSHESVAMYRSVDDLLARAASPDWWVRRHTVLAIGYLIGNRWFPYHGVPDRPNEYAHGPEETLHAAALVRRRECLLALVDRLTDPEISIARQALEQLQEATGQRLAGGVAGQSAWRAWVLKLDQ